ncbi:tripartite tricarboxylate transporter substrate binding protein [Corticibacter populi]|uniref:Tripartite tricarboxylate transporter substrate binding protein n=1 Tax=Corticibacter populi TaxID=1550736 RepID=A0A3M6QPI3_9BURK|nr:tripartite tricarboxylate transporter substrate binding protein [Corticibacter populi]RMX04974.1 tripartite tricarboxylate transporter substrate binding protein [Corticibacter populi]RZS33597.1 tripartite-type tricarboxylate transporter receptor subunit TctC [Corticibacter populi]
MQTLVRLARALAATTALAAAALPITPAAAQDAAWPTKPISLIMGFPAGSGVDVVARVFQEPLGEKLGQPLIIDYKSGAAGNIASEYVARARPDGYTLLFGTAATHGSNAALYKNLPFDVEADFVPVAPVLDVSNVLTINPEVIDAATLADFVRLVRENPGKYAFASTGNGAGTHMAFAEFNARLGLDMLHVPYKGGPEAITSVLRGETCCIMNQVQTVLPHYKSGKVRLLGVTTAKPVAAVPEVPTIASSGVPGTEGFDSSIWFGIFAPKGTDAAIVEKINAAVQEVLQRPDIRERYESQGNAIRLESPEQFRQTVHNDRLKWQQVVEDAHIRLE